jgi:hypothetical protein
MIPDENSLKISLDDETTTVKFATDFANTYNYRERIHQDKFDYNFQGIRQFSTGTKITFTTQTIRRNSY